MVIDLLSLIELLNLFSLVKIVILSISMHLSVYIANS